MTPTPARSLRVEVSTYRGSGAEIQTICLPAAEVRKRFRGEDFDHLLAPAWDEFGYRAPDGTWIQKHLTGSGLGRDAIEIIRNLQLNPGVVLTVHEIARLLGKWGLTYSEALAARLKVIRSFHAETGKMQRFFRSTRNEHYGLWWPAEFSWMWVNRLVPATNGLNNTNGHAEGGQRHV